MRELRFERFRFSTFAVLLALVFTTGMVGCGGRTTFGSRAGVYLSTANAWGAITVIRLTPTGIIQGNTYASLDDAQQAIADDYQPGTSNYTGNVVGSLVCSDPTTPTSTCAMTLKITEQDERTVTVSGPAQFTLDGLDELGPVAVWTEVA